MKTLFQNWTFMRILKISIGVIALASFPKHEEWLVVFVGLFFLLQGILNAGCDNGSCPS